jgi:hypothetical protein
MISFIRRCLKIPTKKERQFLNFCHITCNHLTMAQIDRLIQIIDEEVENTKKIGHKIDIDDVFEEKRVILLIINATGGACSLRAKTFEIGEAYTNEIIEVVFDNLQKQVKKYFELKILPGKSRTWYNCHISVTMGTIFNHIINENFPPP